MQEYLNMLDVRVNRISGDTLLKEIEDTVRQHTKKIFTYLTVHAINLAKGNKEFKDFLNTSDISFPDGEGVRLGAWMLGESLPPRIPLTRWIWKLAGFCEAKELSIYLLGASDSNVKTAAEKLQKRFPNLNIAGYHHGYFDKFSSESEKVVETINACSPNVLLVGFGMPLQERWIGLNKDHLRVNAILTAGSCFDFVAGAMPSAPAWIAKSGFEWLFRLMLEPRRLFVRYIIGNPKFVSRILLQRLSNGKAH